MGLIDYFKAKFFPGANNAPQEQTDTTTVQSVPHAVAPTIQETVPANVEYKDEESERKKTLSLTINDAPCEIEYPYVSISTSGDERVCRMCKQFDGKLFRASEVPQLPLHPFCACAYMFHETPGRKKIRNPADFVMPAKCTQEFCSNSERIAGESDLNRRFQLYEEGLSMLDEFLSPYRAAGWKVTLELICVDWALRDYLSIGDWENAIRVANIATAAGAYSAKEGNSQLVWISQISEASIAALEYLSANPGTLQRNMYKKLCPPCDREALKWFLANSMQIRKEKADKTNRLYVAD